MLARKHDIIACPLSDPCELELPDVGLVELQDPETGELFLADTSSAQLRRRFAQEAAAEEENLLTFFKRTGIDVLRLSTDKPYIDDVRALFRRRILKRR